MPNTWWCHGCGHQYDPDHPNADGQCPICGEEDEIEPTPEWAQST